MLRDQVVVAVVVQHAGFGAVGAGGDQHVQGREAMAPDLGELVHHSESTNCAARPRCFRQHAGLEKLLGRGGADLLAECLHFGHQLLVDPVAGETGQDHKRL